MSFQEKFVKTSCVRKFNNIATISRKNLQKAEEFYNRKPISRKIRQNIVRSQIQPYCDDFTKKIYENQTNFTTENQFHEKIRQNVAHFSNPKKCVSAPDAVAAMVKCDNCHDKIVSDELTS